MSDDIERLKVALAAGPTGAVPGDSTWVAVNGNAVMLDSPRPVWARIASCDRSQTAAYIAACDPATISRLIARLEAAEADARRWRYHLEHMRSGSIGYGDWWINADEPASEWNAAMDAAMKDHK